MNIHMRVLSPWPRSARYVSGLMWGGGIKTKSGSYREFRLSYFKLACKSVCKQPLVVRPECLSVCYGEDLRRAGSFLKCAYWQSQCHSSMQMSSVRRCLIGCFISERRRRRREGGNQGSTDTSVSLTRTKRTKLTKRATSVHLNWLQTTAACGNWVTQLDYL